MSDIRHSLLRRDALSAAKEVLYHLDIYFSSQLQSAPVPLVEKGPIELLEEFIFQVPKERGSHPKRLNAMQELQLLEILCSYFQEQGKEPVRQVIFSSLFSPQGNKADDQRMALLGKLTSMAVAVCRIPVLECAASWLQRTPAVYCVRLAKALVDDYCGLVPGSIQTLKQIFNVSPRFCCQFITAVTTLYDMSTGESCLPLTNSLEMIVSWSTRTPRLILCHLPEHPHQQPPALGVPGLLAPQASSAGAWRPRPTASRGVWVGGQVRVTARACTPSCPPERAAGSVVLSPTDKKNLYGRLGLVLFEAAVPLGKT
ncbi:hypothetical protein FKM82_002699 [Ascaphus truei]